MSNNKNDIELLIAKVLTEEATAQEIEKVNAWKAASEANQKLFEEFARAMEAGLSHYNQSLPEINVDKEWQVFNEKLNQRDAKVVSIGSSTNLWLKIAASVSILLVAGYFLFTNLFSADQIVYQTANQTREIILPDSSTVTLNRYSQLSYSEDFNQKDRSVTLQGEAFFDIQSNKQKPFVIAGGLAEVKVLGTSFNVKIIDDKTEVVVTSGVVLLTAKENQESVELTSGKFGVVSSGENLTSGSNSDPNFNAWKTRSMIFNDQNLQDVLVTLENVYGVQIELSPTLSTACRVTVSFENQSLDSVLSVLEATLDLVIQKSDDKIEIVEAGC